MTPAEEDALVEQFSEDWGLCNDRTIRESFRLAIRAAVAHERERAARVCDARVMGDNNREDQEARRCAAAIRRGE